MTNIGYALYQKYQMGGLSNLVVSVFVLSLLKHLLTNEGDMVPYLRGISICIVVCMSTLKLADTVSFSEDPLTEGRGALSASIPHALEKTATEEFCLVGLNLQQVQPLHWRCLDTHQHS